MKNMKKFGISKKKKYFGIFGKKKSLEFLATED
jgi:hypothetical protein